MTRENDAIINATLTIINADADRKEMAAGQSGSWNDNGAGALRDQIKFYEYGRRGEFPPEWDDYIDQAKRQVAQQRMAQDPEYQEFMRLKEKFNVRAWVGENNG